MWMLHNTLSDSHQQIMMWHLLVKKRTSATRKDWGAAGVVTGAPVDGKG